MGGENAFSKAVRFLLSVMEVLKRLIGSLDHLSGALDERATEGTTAGIMNGGPSFPPCRAGGKPQRHAGPAGRHLRRDAQRAGGGHTERCAICCR